MKLVTLEFLVKSTTLTNVSWSRSRLKNKSYLKCGLRMSEEASRCFFASLITHITQYYHQILRVHYRNGLKDDSAISSVLKLLTRCKVQGGCQWKIDNFDSCLSSEAEHERKPKSGTLISKLAESLQKCVTSITGMHYLQRQLTCCPLNVTGDSSWT